MGVVNSKLEDIKRE